MQVCNVKENCNNFLRQQCWICEDYSLYSPEDKKILCERQLRQREEKKVQKKELKNSEASKRGKRAKKKGYEGEAEIVKILNRYKIQAERVPLSGALKTEEYCSDIKLVVRRKPKRAEVKRRKSGLTSIYKWLDQDKTSNYLFMRQDQKKWVVVMYLEEFMDLSGGEANEW